MVDKPTKLDILVDEAATLYRRLTKLEDNLKLSYEAFLAESLEIAGCDQKRLDEVEKIVNERDGTEEIQVYIRRYSKALREPNFPSPPRDPSRPMRIFGSEELAAQAAQHGLKSGELQCLAVKVTADRFGPLTFGPVEDRLEHEKQTTESRNRLTAIYAEMRWKIHFSP